MLSLRRLFLLVLLVMNLAAVSVMAEGVSIGQFAQRPQLIGYWELVPPNPAMVKIPLFNPGALPYQWFAFYDSGQMVSIKTDDPLRKVTPKDLDNVLKKSPDQVAAFSFKNGFITISEQGSATPELWGVNVITKKVLLAKVEHLPGDLIMSLDSGGKVTFYRHLRRVVLSDYDAGKRGSPIKSLPVAAKDGQTISGAEREIIRTLVPYFTATSEKDTAAMKRIFPDLRSVPDDRLRSLPVKNYTLHGLEDVTYDGSRLRAVAIYSFEIEKPGTIGRNIATISADIHLALKNGSWVIVGWFQRGSDSSDMEYFQDIFSRQEKAEKRYGTANLAKWDGL